MEQGINRRQSVLQNVALAALGIVAAKIAEGQQGQSSSRDSLGRDSGAQAVARSG
jgi:hypothetical protein